MNPLLFSREGEQVCVIGIDAHSDTKMRLESLGFVRDAPVRVVSFSKGNLIVEIKGSRIALDASTAAAISVA